MSKGVPYETAMNMHPAARLAHVVVFNELGDGLSGPKKFDWETGRWGKADG